MKFMVVSTAQLVVLSVATSVITTILTAGFFLFMDYRTLPTVFKDPAGACLKVENVENGHAFNCNDVDVVLRRYKQAK